MVDFPTQDEFFPSGAGNTGPVRSGQRQMYTAVRQMPGGRAVAPLTIAGGSVTPTQYRQAVDTEGAAAADDLANILQDNLPDGALLMISSVDAARVPTVKHGAGGAGQILLADGADLALTSPTIRLLLCRDATTWVEEARFYGSAKAAMRTWLGLGDAATKTVGTAAGNVVALDGSAKLPAVDGSQLTGITNEGVASDLRLAFLKLAELDGDRLNMVAGIADPYADESDVDTGSSSGQSYNSAGDYYTNGDTEVTGQANAISTNFDVAPTLANITDGVVTAQGQANTDNRYIGFTFGSAQTVYKVRFYSLSSGCYLANFRCETYDGSTWAKAGIVAWNAGCSANSTDEATAAAANGWVEFEISAASVQGVRIFGLSRSIASQYSIPEFKAYSAGGTNLTLVSQAFTAASAPDAARVHMQVTEVDSITVNTDLMVDISRDGGTTWTTATLVLAESLADGTKAYEDAAIDISGQPSGTSMKYRVRTANNKEVRIHGIVLQWA